MGTKVHTCAHQGCRKLIPFTDRYCSQHVALHPRETKQFDKTYNVKRNRDTKIKERIAFYNTKQWKQLRKQVIERDNGLDQYALRDGLIVLGKLVDHIVPIEFAPELKDDISNLVLTSMASHKAKTEWEQEHYGTGKSNTINKQAVPIKDIKYIPIKFNELKTI
ncbi:HNH endonuclease [Leuconostoc gasicomitatum]|uniref:HNH endonuclease n=1 Tax=Leuconostoc gasicomitatum TaxID=115778 RepID=UPI000744D176|nr:HNH endonuclease [Leuconostoc gasicomitatum]CUR63445.1 Phage endonuclease [Leuconostoc gasicomitatum KG16-1]